MAGYLICSGHSLKDDTPLERTQVFGNKYHECMWCSLSPKDTSLVRTELFGRRGVLIREGLLYNCLTQCLQLPACEPDLMPSFPQHRNMKRPAASEDDKLVLSILTISVHLSQNCLQHKKTAGHRAKQWNLGLRGSCNIYTVVPLF